LNTPKLAIIDTHAHLDADEFADDCDAVIKRAVEAGVNRIITCGTSVESSKKAIALAEKYPQVYASMGVHPQEIIDVWQSDIREIAQLAKHPRVVAIGEIGLDFYRGMASRDEQIRVLKWQLETASALRLPVIIHVRQATDEMIKILDEWVSASYVKTPGVIHCFQESIPVANTFLKMGFYLAFGGYITYPGSRLADVIKTVPPDRLLIETDCPYLPPQKYRGGRNEPAHITYTLEKIAEILGTPSKTVANLTTENAIRLFKFQ
jgi:TatD DNase family protein